MTRRADREGRAYLAPRLALAAELVAPSPRSPAFPTYRALRIRQEGLEALRRQTRGI